jgi:hypothetical protein
MMKQMPTPRLPKPRILFQRPPMNRVMDDEIPYVAQHKSGRCARRDLEISGQPKGQKHDRGPGQEADPDRRRNISAGSRVVHGVEFDNSWEFVKNKSVQEIFEQGPNGDTQETAQEPEPRERGSMDGLQVSQEKPSNQSWIQDHVRIVRRFASIHCR